MQKNLMLPLPRGLRLGRLLQFGVPLRSASEPALDFVERIVRERPVVRLRDAEEGERGFNE